MEFLFLNMWIYYNHSCSLAVYFFESYMSFVWRSEINIWVTKGLVAKKIWEKCYRFENLIVVYLVKKFLLLWKTKFRCLVYKHFHLYSIPIHLKLVVIFFPVLITLKLVVNIHAIAVTSKSSILPQSIFVYIFGHRKSAHYFLVQNSPFVLL